MEWLHLFLAVLIGVVSCSHNWIFTSALDLTASRGDNITLYCDCKLSAGVYIVWYRNCSHENQPTLVLKTYSQQWRDFEKNFLRFKFVRNFLSESYDLQIINVTDSDEGLYYCATEQPKVEEKESIARKCIYTYGNITTRVKVNTISESQQRIPKDDCDNKVCWILLSSVCPAFAVLSSLISVFIYHLCHQKGKDHQTYYSRPPKREQTRRNQDEDVCYAALEIHQTSQRPKKRKESSNFSTYSAINTCSV